MITNDQDIIIPNIWRDLPVERWRSPVIVVGGSDSGKTTFASYLYRRLLDLGEPVAFIDIDPGQNAFGLPTTIAMGIDHEPKSHDAATSDQHSTFPPQAFRRHMFIGSNTPVQHEARVLASLHRLRSMASAAGASRMIVDTSGFIDTAHGAAELKWAEIDLLSPCTVVAFQREAELNAIVDPWRYDADVEIIVLPVSEYVRARSREARRAYRAACYRCYFKAAQRLPLHFQNCAIYAAGPWSLHRLIALEGVDGCVLALAMITDISEAVVWITTPWVGPTMTPAGTGNVTAVRIGTIGLNPITFEDYPQGCHYV